LLLPRFDPRIIALVLGLVGPSGSPSTLPAPAEVSVESLEVFDEPDERSVSSGTLTQGTRVTVRQVDQDGWLSIDAPPGSFRWIEQRAIENDRQGNGATVIIPQASVRAGHPGAAFPGARRAVLPKGTTVRLLDHPPLILGQGPRKQIWRAIAPIPGEQRRIRIEGITWTPKTKTASLPPAETRAAFIRESAPRSTVPPQIAAEVARIEASHRAILLGPVENWQFTPVVERYQALLKRVSDPDAVQAIETRLQVVSQHQEAASSIRSLDEILARSRRRDHLLALEIRRLSHAAERRERPYDAEGMVQASSKQVDGQRVFALIGPEGTTLAYLNIPAGLDPAPFVTRRVGVRGSARYDEKLRARLIAVQDLDPLDEDR